MPQRFVRFIAFILIGCLINDPLIAAGIDGQAVACPNLPSEFQRPFASPAFNMPLVFPLHALGTSVLEVRHSASGVAHAAFQTILAHYSIFAAVLAAIPWLLLTGGILMAADGSDWLRPREIPDDNPR